MRTETLPKEAGPSRPGSVMIGSGGRRERLGPKLPLRRVAVLFSVLADVLSMGCQDPRAGRSGVSGSVTFDGSPVAEGTISFVPAGDTLGPLTGGNIVEGRYAIARGDGPLAGKYRVDIVALRKTGKKLRNFMGEATEEEKEAFLPKGKYSGTTSTLEVQIGAGDNTRDFALTSK